MSDLLACMHAHARPHAGTHAHTHAPRHAHTHKMRQQHEHSPMVACVHADRTQGATICTRHGASVRQQVSE
jgi:hypothetical protein